jgi:DNA-binding response OmpR family regulator
MIEDRNVIVLQDEGAFRDSLVQELTEYDFVVRSCSGMLGFFQLYATYPTSVVVLMGMPHTLASNAAKIRKKTALAAIVALGRDVNVAGRLRIMRSGADACHDVFTDIRELTAIFLAWGRHTSVAMATEAKAGATVPSPAASSQASWRLSANERVLGCPHGHTLSLTNSENNFLNRMATSQQRLVRWYDRRPVGNELETNTAEIRNVDVLVSRLCRKARHAGMDLPLLVVHGCGYLFVECLDVSLTESP